MFANAFAGLNRQWSACLLSARGLALAAPFPYITNGGSGTISVIDTASNVGTIDRTPDSGR